MVLGLQYIYTTIRIFCDVTRNVQDFNELGLQYYM